jgi:signal peptidase II
MSMALVGCDHATKLAAATALRGKTVALVPGVLDLTYTENHDVAFSLLRDAVFPHKSIVLICLAMVGSIFVAIMWMRRRNVASRFEHIGWSLTLAGALGNMVDRVIRGYVIDFIHLQHWPVFNVADIVVVLGVIALVLARKTPTPIPSS